MTDDTIIDHKGLQQLGIRYCRVHLRRREREQKFPKSFKLGEYPNSPRVWWRHEVVNWLKERAKTTPMPTPEEE
jgi:hypothetical protein